MDTSANGWFGLDGLDADHGRVLRGIALLLAVYSTLGMLRPSLPRKGLLPMRTTRGERPFVRLLGAADINLAWVGLSDAPQWSAAVLWLPWMFVVARPG